MKATYIVTDKNKAKYIRDVELDGVFIETKNEFNGLVEIRFMNNGIIPSEGQHGAHDFEDEYGFRIVPLTEQTPKKQTKRQAAYKLDPDVIDAVKRRAEAEDRSEGYIVNKILRSAFEL